ncbi:hypothetical protein UFOVP257_128 [uncultured Caudovirales phage]|uniref:Uncharacterized protein n=1 Tax=uncultured Caudovirales phage TaxID=2100421 RepID=A0A6J5LNP2_9CAUD|nr:hypothetical protein UFOVP257_128 [uncultured Caudovirales phage]
MDNFNTLLADTFGDSIHVRVLETELYDVIRTAPIKKNKEEYIHRFLDSFFSKDELLISFNKKILLIHYEPVTVEILTAIHTWIHKQCSDISNIWLMTNFT